MTRRSLTPKEKAAMIEAQGGLCGCSCGQPVTMETGDGEHCLPVGLGNARKPDSVWRRDCHKTKTARDLAQIAKAKRQGKKHRGEVKPKKPIQSRGFDKRLRKRMDGAVEVSRG